MPSLILLKSPSGGVSNQSFVLNLTGKSEFVIGRDKARCDIVIDDGEQQVSRRQAVITAKDGHYFVQHAGRNPTFVNNKSLDLSEHYKLKSEDRLKICDFLFRFHDEAAAVAVPLPLAMLNQLPDPPESDHEMTTVYHSVNRAAAQQFLEVQPAEQLRILLTISTALSRTLELDSLLEQIAESLFTVFRQADRCFVIQLDEANRPYPKVFKSRRPNTGDRFSKTIIRRCLETNEAYLSEDASADSALGAAQSIADFRIRSVMCVPLSTTDGKPLGVIQLDTQDTSKKFRNDDLKLLTIVSNLASIAVEKAHVHAMLLKREKAQQQIEIARNVQIGFLPKGPPDVPGYEFYGYYSAAETVGGDYYDYLQLPGGRIAVVLGDVAGKGVAAAMLMAKLSAESRFAFLSEPNQARALMLLNSQLIRGGIGDRFVTLVAMILDPVAHVLTIVNAGHQNPLRYHSIARFVDECVTQNCAGMPLGAMDDYQYEMEQIRLEPNQTIVVFTDGVTDASNRAGVMFEITGVYRTLQDDKQIGDDPSPRSIGERLAEVVKRHADGAPPSDDIALVCFGRTHRGDATTTSTRVPTFND